MSSGMLTRSAILHPQGKLESANHPPLLRPQNEHRKSQRTRQFQAAPGGTLGRGSLAELGNTLAIMANEVSMMWEHLFDVEGSRVCTRRVNALVIDKLTAVKFIL